MSTRSRLSERAPLRPVPRRRVALGVLVALLGFGGVVLLAEVLRHPAASGEPGVPELEEPEADPRFEVVCEPAREGDGPDGTVVTPSAAREVTSNELYDCPTLWDGEAVRYRGEVVGAVLQRRTGAWVQLNDDVYGDPLGPLPSHRDYRGGNAGVGVFVPLDLAQSIEFVGGPRAQGDILEIEGTFHRFDPDSGEAAVIRATFGEIAQRGNPFDDPVLPDRRIVAWVLLPLAAAATLAERLVARRR